jgi:hypothetical protein
MAGKAKDVDWTAIEGAYRAGTEPLRAIADRHGITEGAIRARAKKFGWTRDAAKTKRELVAARMAGVTQEITQDVMRNIEDAAAQDVIDLERGARIHRLCLLGLEAAAEKADDPREIKTITEATAAAIASLRKIRGLDAAPGGSDGNEDDAGIADALARRLEEAAANEASRGAEGQSAPGSIVALAGA